MANTFPNSESQWDYVPYTASSDDLFPSKLFSIIKRNKATRPICPGQAYPDILSSKENTLPSKVTTTSLKIEGLKRKIFDGCYYPKNLKYSGVYLSKICSNIPVISVLQRKVFAESLKVLEFDFNDNQKEMRADIVVGSTTKTTVNRSSQIFPLEIKIVNSIMPTTKILSQALSYSFNVLDNFTLPSMDITPDKASNFFLTVSNNFDFREYILSITSNPAASNVGTRINDLFKDVDEKFVQTTMAEDDFEYPPYVKGIATPPCLDKWINIINPFEVKRARVPELCLSVSFTDTKKPNKQCYIAGYGLTSLVLEFGTETLDSVALVSPKNTDGVISKVNSNPLYDITDRYYRKPLDNIFELQFAMVMNRSCNKILDTTVPNITYGRFNAMVIMPVFRESGRVSA